MIDVEKVANEASAEWANNPPSKVGSNEVLYVAQSVASAVRDECEAACLSVEQAQMNSELAAVARQCYQKIREIAK